MLLEPRRSGQPHSNDIDWKIAALDALGLLLFFVPGVIAFAVDFYTGAIYMPLEPPYPGYGPGPYLPPAAPPPGAVPPPVSSAGPPSAAQPAGKQLRPPAPQYLGLKRLDVPRDQLQPQYIEQVVAKQAGRQVSLSDSEARLSELARIDQFDEQLDRHRADRNFGYSVRSFFAKLAQA